MTHYLKYIVLFITSKSPKSYTHTHTKMNKPGLKAKLCLQKKNNTPLEYSNLTTSEKSYNKGYNFI